MNRIDLLSDGFNIKYNFNIFDWSKEPTESWKELKKQRAQHIRDNYDYVVLYCSGGSDSTTVLNSFYDNNIYIDEIVTTVYDKFDSLCLSGKKAFSDVYKNNLFGKYTVVNLKFDKIKNFLKNDLYLEESPDFTGGLHSIARFNLDYLEKFDFINPSKRSGNVCHLYGTDNPIIYKDNETFYARESINFLASYYKKNTSFFSSPEFPNIHIKQCYIMAKAIKKFNDVNYRDIIRDENKPLISGKKPSGNPKFILKSKGIYSEPTILISQYKKEDGFIDLYTKSTIINQLKIQEKIDLLKNKFTKDYKLNI